ncbi:MAG: zinc-regulated TonB-dependent outer membrane receptor [Halothiobacillaceae bacterium]
MKTANTLASLTALTLVLGTATLPATADESFSIGGVDLDFSLTLDGVYYDRFSGQETDPAGFGHGHAHADHGHEDHDHDHDHDHEDHGHGKHARHGGHGHGGHGHKHGFDDGFNLGHSEISMRARTDLFDGIVNVAFNDEDIHVEEAYLQTRALPAGFQLKAGKFLSSIGYINSRHPHAWDFIERPLVNRYLFGDHGLHETGAQLTYVLPTSTFMVVGTELLQGNGEGLNAWTDEAYHDRDNGPRLWTAFVKAGPELPAGHAVQLGTSWGISRQYARLDDHGNHKHTVEGDAWFGGLDAMYRYESGRPYGHGNWRIGGEYYYVNRSVNARGYKPESGWRQNPNDFTEKQDGLYAEAVYGIAPRWEIGFRAEALGLNNDVLAFHPTGIVDEATSYRYALQATWSIRETMILRAQLTHDDYGLPGDSHAYEASHDHDHHDGPDGKSWAFMLQFNALLGSHPAHRF